MLIGGRKELEFKWLYPFFGKLIERAIKSKNRRFNELIDIAIKHNKDAFDDLKKCILLAAKE